MKSYYLQKHEASNEYKKAAGAIFSKPKYCFYKERCQRQGRNLIGSIEGV